MTRWFIALLWVALLLVIAVMVWPDAKTEATAKTKTVTKTDAKADVTTVAKIFETMVTNAEAIRQALCVALAPLAAYLVLYAFAVDGDEFIPLDWIAKLLWPFLYLFSLGRRTALMPRGTTARVLETIGWPLSIDPIAKTGVPPVPVRMAIEPGPVARERAWAGLPVRLKLCVPIVRPLLVISTV